MLVPISSNSWSGVPHSWHSRTICRNSGSPSLGWYWIRLAAGLELRQLQHRQRRLALAQFQAIDPALASRLQLHLTCHLF
jgi:hypothetical protein